MTWRRRQRRRLLWAGVLLGLLVLVAVASTLRAGLRIRDELNRLVSPAEREDALLG